MYNLETVSTALQINIYSIRKNSLDYSTTVFNLFCLKLPPENGSLKETDRGLACALATGLTHLSKS